MRLYFQVQPLFWKPCQYCPPCFYSKTFHDDIRKPLTIYCGNLGRKYLTSVWRLESISIKYFFYFLIKKPFLSLVQLKTANVAYENLCDITLLRVIFEAVSSFLTNTSFSPQKTHCTGATVSVGDLCLALICSTFWGPSSLERLFFIRNL